MLLKKYPFLIKTRHPRCYGSVTITRNNTKRRKIVDTIDVSKDVDGLTSASLGKLITEHIEIHDPES